MNSNSLVEQNLGLVHMCAGRFKERGIEYEELYSAGCLGLVKASRNFNPELGYAFSTYAVPVILGEIKQCFRNAGDVKVSRGLKEKARECAGVLDRLEGEKGSHVSIKELAEEMHMGVSEVAQLLNISAPALSIDGDDENSFDIPDKPFENESIDRLTVESLLENLDENDRTLITMRYFEERTQSEVAKRLNMTQVQVSRREKVLLCIMRNKFENVSVIW